MIHYIDSFPGTQVAIGDTSYTYFGGTAYLGLPTQEKFQKLYIKNIKKYGTNYGASRKSNIRFSVYEKAEQLLAKFVGAESAITMSSGYLAGQFLAQELKNKNYEFFYAPNTHSALFLDSNKKETNYVALKLEIERHLVSKKNSIPVLFLDSIDFSGLNYPDFVALKTLPLSEIILVIDDSHGIGIVGENGNGVYNMIKQLKPKNLFVCCSLGKGFGIQAGAIFGNKEDMKWLRNTSFFGGASPATPAAIATLLEAQSLFVLQRSTLKQHLKTFQNTVVNIKNFMTISGHPTFSYENPKLTQTLFEHKILVTNFNYPNEESAVMSRIVLSASHTEKDIAHLVKILNKHLS